MASARAIASGGLSVTMYAAAALSGAVALAVLVFGVGFGPEAPEGASGGDSVKAMDASASPDGVRIEMKVAFAKGLTLSKPRAAWGDLGSAGANFWPVDGRDHEGEDLDPLRLTADTEVLISSYLRPSFRDRSGGDDEFSFRVLVADGDRATTRSFRPSDSDDLAAALDDWCASSPSVDATGSMQAPDGRAEVYLVVTNPGKKPIEVEIPAYSGGGTDWAAVKETVPAGGRTEITVKATGAACDAPGEGSWESGRLLIDGTSVDVTGEDGWCG